MLENNKASILFLEPYNGGSHKSFIDEWQANSKHNFTVLGLPPYKWRWRMRHSAVTFAQQLETEPYLDKEFDLIICSSMLDLAKFKGLASSRFNLTPCILYMHENQLTYPVPEGAKRDSDAVFMQLTSCLAADEIWWNSKHNMDSFLTALPKYLKRMPDYKLPGSTETIERKSKVMPLGIHSILKPEDLIKPKRDNKKLSITWAARWEHDKNPEDFFKALHILKEKEIDFELNVIGEQFRSYPVIFDKAKEDFSAYIKEWGYLPSKEQYKETLKTTDIIVSTAIHEFFGLSILEGVSAGAYPLLPNRLSYPEIFCNQPDYFYDGTPENLAQKLEELSKTTHNEEWKNKTKIAYDIAAQYNWSKISIKLDNEATKLIKVTKQL